MTFARFVTFVVLKILDNFVSIADIIKISKTVQRKLTFILNALSESSIHFTQLSIVLPKKMLVLSHKMVRIKNEAALLCVTMRERATAFAAAIQFTTLPYSLQLIAIQLLPLKSLVFVVHFSMAFWHRNEPFPKGSSQKLFLSLQFFTCRIVNMRVQKYVFTRAAIKIKPFHSCRTRVVRVALVSYSCRWCLNRVSSVALVSHSCGSCLALVLQIRLDLKDYQINTGISIHHHHHHHQQSQRYQF